MSDTNDYLQEAAVRIGNLEDENAELRQRVEAAEYNFGVEHDALVLTESQRDALSAVVSQLKAHIENAPSNLADTNARLTVQLVEARERINALAVALRKYARHCPGCGMARAISPGQCDCGFIAALAGIPVPACKHLQLTQPGDGRRDRLREQLAGANQKILEMYGSVYSLKNEVIEQAVTAERERCANLVENAESPVERWEYSPRTFKKIAAAIRRPPEEVPDGKS